MWCLAYTSGLQDAGTYALALAIISPIIGFCSFGIRSVYVSDVDRSFSTDVYSGVRLLSGILASGLIGLIAAVSWASDAKDLGSILIFLGAIKVIENQYELDYATWQSRGELTRVSLSLLRRGAYTLTPVPVVLILFKGSVEQALALNWMLVAVDRVCLRLLEKGKEVKQSRGEAIGVSLKILTKLISQGLPLSITSLCTLGGASIPRMLLANLAGASTLGAYATMATVVQTGAIVATSIGQSKSRMYAVEFHKRNHEKFWMGLRRSLISVALLSLISSAIALVLDGYELAPQITTMSGALPRYSLALMLVAACLQYSVTTSGYAVVATKRNRGLLILQASSLLVILVLGYFMLIEIGVWGVILAQAVAAAIVLAGYYRLIKSAWNYESH